MGTQLILLVGTNPLPVWVAWQYLRTHLEQPVTVRLVYTENTQDEVERLKAELSGASFLPDIKTSPGNPAVVHDNIRTAINPLPPETAHVHIHYTGGTKVMAVETVTAVERYNKKSDNSFRVATSYLDPRGDTGPALVNHQGHKIVRDTRQLVTPDLGQIARLNGFVTGQFFHQYYSPRHQGWKTKDCPEPTQLSEPTTQAGRVVLTEVSNQDKRRFFLDTFISRDNPWDKEFTQFDEEIFTYPDDAGTFSLPSPIQPWQQRLLRILNTMCPHCPWDVATGTLSYLERSIASTQTQADLAHMHRFFKGIWLEYAAYDALQQALEQTAKRNKIRMNYRLFHGVYIRRAESQHRVRRTQHGDYIKPFELDVVAVLGYQVLVVSCSGFAGEADIKLKAMEAIIRARQLGGDEARAVVICRAVKNAADNVQAEVEDEMGGEHLPLQVWGVNRWNDLQKNFQDYLNKELRWT